MGIQKRKRKGRVEMKEGKTFGLFYNFYMKVLVICLELFSDML